MSLLWALPIAVIALLILIAVAKRLRETTGVQSFIDRYPGTIAPPKPTSVGIPWWARAEHFFNLFFMMFIIRSGLQILADHPRLYFDRNCTPGRDWFRFQNPVPRDRVWTAKEDSVRLPGWLGIPGLRHSIGLARWWHFGFDLLWLANGVIFYILVFATGHWQRIVPTSWDVFPNALSTLIQYLSLDWPKDQGWIAYNGLQLLALLHHRVHRRAVGADDGPVAVTRDLEPLPARRPAAQPSACAHSALLGAVLVLDLHLLPHGNGLHDR